MTKSERRKQVIVGITGASGAVYARGLVRCLCEADTDVHLIVSPNGQRLLREELDLKEVSPQALVGRETHRVVAYPYRDVGAALASGGFQTDAMIICPCSSNTLGSLANGLAGNLLDRAAAVTLKEARRLIIVPREMPTSRIDLLNLLRLSEAGAIICPASPGFYMRPTGIDDLVDFVVGKILDLVAVPHRLNTRWGKPLEENRGGAER